MHQGDPRSRALRPEMCLIGCRRSHRKRRQLAVTQFVTVATLGRQPPKRVSIPIRPSLAVGNMVRSGSRATSLRVAQPDELRLREFEIIAYRCEVGAGGAGLEKVNG
jgi:hypothetical protein